MAESKFKTPSKEDLFKFCMEMAGESPDTLKSSQSQSQNSSETAMSNSDFDSAFDDFLSNEQETLAAVLSKSMGMSSSTNSSDLGNSMSSSHVDSDSNGSFSSNSITADSTSNEVEETSNTGHVEPSTRFTMSSSETMSDIPQSSPDVQATRTKNWHFEPVDESGGRETQTYEFGDRYIDVSTFTGGVSTEEINTTPEHNYTFNPGEFRFNGTNFNFRTETKDISEGVSTFSEQATPEDTFRSYEECINSFTEQLINHFGGLDRIGSFLLKDGLVIVNQCAFTPNLGNKIMNLPEDVRVEVSQQNYRWLINYAILKKMPNVQFLSFEDVGFVSLKVRKDLGIAYGFSHAHFFKFCKNLQCLELGGTIYNRHDYHDKENVFELHDRIESCMNSISSTMLSSSVWCWGKLRDVYMNPSRSGLGKAMGIVFGTPLSVAGGLLTGGIGIGAKAANLGRKGAHGLKNFLGTVKNNF